MPDFKDIIGHEEIISHLKNAVRLKKISHAYIFDGEEGAGKNLLAQTFAQTLQCEKGGEDPCGVCRSCKQAVSSNQPDIIYVRHEKPGSIGVEDIREQLCGDIQIRPYSSPYKIYLIDEAEKMTVQAQNALLKTIEEPPSYGVIFLLTTNSESFLPVQLVQPLPFLQLNCHLTLIFLPGVPAPPAFSAPCRQRRPFPSCVLGGTSARPPCTPGSPSRPPPGLRSPSPSGAAR